MRTHEGMAVARARGELKGRRPELPAPRQAELVGVHATGDQPAESDAAPERSRAADAAGWASASEPLIVPVV